MSERAPERTEAETVNFVVVDRIAWVSFNRPEKRNCMSPSLQPPDAAGAGRAGVSR